MYKFIRNCHFFLSKWLYHFILPYLPHILYILINNGIISLNFKHSNGCTLFFYLVYQNNILILLKKQNNKNYNQTILWSTSPPFYIQQLLTFLVLVLWFGYFLSLVVTSRFLSILNIIDFLFNRWNYSSFTLPFPSSSSIFTEMIIFSSSTVYF